MAALDALEKQLDDVFVKKAPFQLPENAKKAIVQYLPWINLVFGLISLWLAYSVWQWIDRYNNGLGELNNYLEVFGAKTVEVSPLVYVGLALLALTGVLYILAFMSTKDRKKSGWNLMFYALIINTIYGIVMAFTDYSNAGGLIGTIIGTVIGLYFLFQIRSHYTGSTVRSERPTTPAAQ